MVASYSLVVLFHYFASTLMLFFSWDDLPMRDRHVYIVFWEYIWELTRFCCANPSWTSVQDLGFLSLSFSSKHLVVNLFPGLFHLKFWFNFLSNISYFFFLYKLQIDTYTHNYIYILTCLWVLKKNGLHVKCYTSHQVNFIIISFAP